MLQYPVAIIQKAKHKPLVLFKVDEDNKIKAPSTEKLGHLNDCFINAEKRNQNPFNLYSLLV